MLFSHLDKIENLNNTNTYSNNNKVDTTLESLSENFDLNKEDVLHPTSFKTIIRFQQKDKYLIGIVKEKPNDYSIKQFDGAGKTYSLICKQMKIMIPNQIQRITLIEWYHNVLCHPGETRSTFLLERPTKVRT